MPSSQFMLSQPRVHLRQILVDDAFLTGLYTRISGILTGNTLHPRDKIISANECIKLLRGFARVEQSAIPLPSRLETAQEAVSDGDKMCLVLPGQYHMVGAKERDSCVSPM